jgi:geranylgeranyl diphosphate synthase, type II
LGTIAAKASTKYLTAITAFGCTRGLAVQGIDDILDLTQTLEKKLGKRAGKDVATKKATYPVVIGLGKSRAEAKRLTSDAHSALKSLEESATVLRALADHLLQRGY